jgi:hypothetical protein
MASGSHRSGSNPGSSQETWWDVVEIVEEDGKRYRVRWAGKDPKTGKPWPLDWIPTSHCSLDLIRDWEKKKGASSYNCTTWTQFFLHTEQYSETEETGFACFIISVKVLSGFQTAV